MSGAKSRSKYNAPGTLNDRYRMGNRRWSPLVEGEERSKGRKTSDELYWTVVVTVTGGCGGGGTKTYACNCPDKAKQEVATPGYASRGAKGKEFTPRIFTAASIRSYRSLYQRYVRARQIFSQVQYRGILPNNRFVYQIPTSRSGIENTRSWTGSQAGSPSDCKHIMAVKMFRGEFTLIPLDAPEDPLDL